MVHGRTYTDPATGRFLRSAEIDLITDPKFPKFILPNGARVNVNVSYEKMSKSKHNGVDPGNCIRKYGADATRVHVLFSAPVSEVLEWDEERIVGVQRWFGRVWKVVGDVARLLAATQSTPSDRTNPLDHTASPRLSSTETRLQATLHHTIRNVTASLEGAYGLNTIVSSLMELTNNITSTHYGNNPETTQHALSVLLRLLAPIAPAFASECWEILHSPPTCRRQINNILRAPWPTTSFPASRSTAQTELTCAVQINGKLRFVTTLSPGPSGGITGEALREWLITRLADVKAGGKWLGEGKAMAARRVVVVGGGKVVNFVF
jgi:leucyl-tRNA synthetase